MSISEYFIKINENNQCILKNEPVVIKYLHDNNIDYTVNNIHNTLDIDNPSNNIKILKNILPHILKTDVFNFHFVRKSKQAIAPFKTCPTDSGFDLSVVKYLKCLKDDDNVRYYDTEISVEPPHGYYFDLVPRSSLHKKGWTLANNVGIIDNTYRGNIIVALIKTREDAEEIELPARIVQLIPRKLILFNPVEVKNLSETRRGDGGFGSTGN